MNLPFDRMAFASVLALVVGIGLMLNGQRIRHRRGLGGGRTVSLDRVTLTSDRYRLTGRPDRLVKTISGMIIPEEWKSSKSLRPWHRIQIGVYFLLIEEQLRITPTHGFIVLGDHKRHLIENTTELRAEVMMLGERIRKARVKLDQEIPVRPKSGQCRPCGMLRVCSQARV